MKKNLLSCIISKFGVALLALPMSAFAQATFYNLSLGNYSQDFAEISTWGNSYASGAGANNWRVATSVATSTGSNFTVFSSGVSGGVQKGSASMVFLATGSNAGATDLLLNFSGRLAGNLSFNWTKIANTANNTSPRTSDLKLQYSLDNGLTFTDLTGYTIPRISNNDTPETGSINFQLPAALDNQAQVVLRFYFWNNGQTTGGGNRPKWDIDNVLVASSPSGTFPVITGFSPSSGFPGATVTINGFNFGATPAVRFNGVAAASPTVNPAGTQITAVVPGSATTGPISVEVAGEPIATSATVFTVLAPNTPIITLSTNTISGLSTSTGVASATTNYSVTGTNLGVTPITVVPDSDLLQIGTNGTDFTNSLSIAPVGGVVSNSIFLRVAATNLVTNYSASISHVSGSASSSLAVSGAITNLPPGIVANPTNITGLNAATTNVPSAAQTFTLTGSNLTNDVTVSAPAGFEVANDGATWGTATSLSQTGGSVNGTISVRLAPSSAFGPRSGSVTSVSTGFTNRVSVSGSVPVPDVPGQVYWNFDAATPTSGTGGEYASWTFGPLTRGNNNGTTTLFTNASVSSGYTNIFNVLASGSTNAGASARTGAFNAASNAFFEVQIVVPTSTATSITNISFGSRPTGTGPAAYSIRSSADDFAADVVTNAMVTNTWAIYTAPVAIALSNGTNTIRIYGFNGAGSASAGTVNWRIDDLTLALGTGTGPNPPSGLSYTPSSANGVVGTAITNMVPTVTGTVASYSVSPTLPSGLSINPASGVISGTPTAVATSASFTVTASNAGGATTAQVTIAVVSAYDAWAASYSLSGASALPTADPDSDGLNNNNEYAFGTNPTVSNASLLTATTSAGNMTVTWVERNSGFVYNVQSTVNLVTTAFATDGTVTVVAGPTDPAPPAGYTRKQFTVPASNNKFFRVRATAN